MSDNVTLSEFLSGLPNEEFKPSITINRSEGFIEAFYRDCSYVVKPNGVSEGYYSVDTNELIGWRVPLYMNERIEVIFK